MKAEDGEAGALKKFKLDEFYKHSRIAANQLIAGKCTLFVCVFICLYFV